MTKQTFEQDLAAQLKSLPSERKPDRDLWKGIELAIEQESHETNSKPQQKRYLAVAASFALVACLSWFGWQSMPIDEAQPAAVLNGEQLVNALSQQHQQQKNALLVKFADQTATTDNWQQQLEELDDAAGAIKAALQEDPDNTALLQMLQHVYQQQIALIERVHAPKWQQI